MQQRLQALPQVKELIRTDRLELRAPVLGDARAVARAVQASLTELAAWMPWAVEDYGEPHAEESIRFAMADFVLRRDLRYHVFDALSNELVGSTGLHRIDWRVPRFEIGYWLASRFTGNGYATESTRALTAYAFEDLGAARVELRCDDRNLASAAVAERSGFELEGVMRNAVVDVDGAPAHTRVYALTSAPKGA